MTTAARSQSTHELLVYWKRRARQVEKAAERYDERFQAIKRASAEGRRDYDALEDVQRAHNEFLDAIDFAVLSLYGSGEGGS